MADKKISQLTLKTSLVSDDVITILDSEASLVNKKATIEEVMTYSAEALTANAPLTKSGKVFGISQATSGADGYLSSADWTTFNSKQATMSAEAPISIVNNEIQCEVATSSTDGYLISDDWNTFNEKANAQFAPSSVSSPITLTAGYLYKFSSAITELTISNYIDSTEEIEIQFTTGASFSFTASAWTNYWINEAPTFEVSKSYVIAIKNGYAIWGEVA